MITDDGGSPTITVDSGGTLAKTGGTGTSTIEGVQVTASGTLSSPTGTLALNGVTLAGNPTGVGNVALTGSTTVSGNATLSGNWQVTGGSMDLPTGSSLTVDGTVSWSAGTIYGPGTLTVASGATLTDDATSDVPYLEAPLVVDGTFNVAATNNYYGLFMESYGGEPGSITVPSHGALNLALDDPGYAMITDDGGSPTITVDSGGTLAKTGGTGTSTIEGVQVTASGTLSSPTGTLALNGVTLAGNPTGVGNVALIGSTTLSGNATLSGNWQWPSGTIYGTDSLTIAAGATLTDDATTNSTPTLEAPLVVDGTFNVAATNSYYGLFMDSYTDEPSSITVASGALNLALDDPDYAMILADAGSPTITVDSGGTLAKTGGTGTSTIQGVGVTSSGTVAAPSGTLSLDDLTNLSGGTLTGGTYDAGTPTTAGTIDINGSVTTNDATVSIVGSGLLAGRRLDSALSGLTTNGAQGSIDTSDGASLPAGGDLANSGSLIGSGTITTTRLTNTGLVEAIDGGPAILADTGDYTQSGPGNLEVAFNGTGAHQASELTVAGTATLGGTLTVATGFTPSLGNSFTLLTAASHTGQFALVDWAGLPAGLAYSVNYANAGQVTVSVVNAPAALPVVTGLSTQTGPGTGNTTVTVDRFPLHRGHRRRLRWGARHRRRGGR